MKKLTKKEQEIVDDFVAMGGKSITWTGGGTLESAASLPGTWAPVAGNPTSPHLVNPTEVARYYRVRQ